MTSYKEGDKTKSYTGSVDMVYDITLFVIMHYFVQSSAPFLFPCYWPLLYLPYLQSGHVPPYVNIMTSLFLSGFQKLWVALFVTSFCVTRGCCILIFHPVKSTYNFLLIWCLLLLQASVSQLPVHLSKSWSCQVFGITNSTC